MASNRGAGGRKGKTMSSQEKQVRRPINEARTKKNKARRAESRAKGIPAQPHFDAEGNKINNREFRRIGLAPKRVVA